MPSRVSFFSTSKAPGFALARHDPRVRMRSAKDEAWPTQRVCSGPHIPPALQHGDAPITPTPVRRTGGFWARKNRGDDARGAGNCRGRIRRENPRHALSPAKADMGLSSRPGNCQKCKSLSAEKEVDGGDLLIYQQNFGLTGATFEQGDANGDGVVGYGDYTIFMSCFGESGGHVDLRADFNFASSAESVGVLRLRKCPEVVIEGGFHRICSSKAVRFSQGEFAFVVESFDNS